MLIVYLDEFGHVGPYISPKHKKYHENPVFGYGGFVIPEVEVRRFGGYFEHIKERLLAEEIRAANVHPRRWEKKGASLLTTKNYNKYGSEMIPALKRISRELKRSRGNVFFFGQEKSLGPVSISCESTQEREKHCLIQTIKRVGSIGASKDDEIMVIMDATEADNRTRAVSTLGSTIFSRHADKDLSRVVDIPLQADSHLYGTVQFADWICALLGRLCQYHFSESREFSWSVDLANYMFNSEIFTPNSFIWTNEHGNFKLSPQKMLQAEPYWEKRILAREKNKTKRQENKTMMSSVMEACSPEFKERYFLS